MWISLVITCLMATNALAACPEGWTAYEADNTCLKVTSKGKGFDASREICQSEGGDAVHIADSQKTAAVEKVTGKHFYWIGVYDKDHTGDFTYLDGTQLDDNYSPWFPNEPSNGAGKEYCVSAVNGKWQTLRCGFPWRFVCEKPGVKECPSDYTYYKEDDSCLKAHSDKKSFHAAREVCKAEGGDLARLDNGDITSFAVDMEPSYFWLGAWDPQKNNHWQFLDGSPVGDFHPWDNGEPNNYRKREHCVMAYGQTSTDRPGKWNDAYCEMSLAFVCQI